MNNIEWKDGAVCYAYKRQWFFDGSGMLACDFQTVKCGAAIIMDDFQLNEIRTGDFIQASELDTEQKYNDVVEVFGLFGFEWGKNASTGYFDENSLCDKLRVSEDGLFKSDFDETSKTRKLTYPQIIAIGKLKRMMLEREKSAPKTTPDLTPDFTKASSSKYEREITDRQGNSATVDVYDVIIAYGVTCPATQHAIKKLLCTGDRGHKDTLTDLSEARDAITRAIELN